ncbi:hypothetical protein HYQ44_017196 [Verticillium longisporum]|nr:hypothetical protein HYQ44_017196 [Verticillium longisporum]
MHAILRWSNLCASWLSGPACKKFEHSDTALRSPFRSHMARTIQYHGRRLTPTLFTNLNTWFLTQHTNSFGDPSSFICYPQLSAEFQ